MIRYQHYLLITITAILLVACSEGERIQLTPTPSPTPLTEPHIEVITEGLLGPIGLTQLPDGSLLVAEAGTGNRDNSGGVTLIKPNGQAGRLISGFPSSRDAGDLAGVNLVALAPTQDKIYLGNFGQGHLWVLPLTSEQQQVGLDIPESPLTADDLTPAMMRLNNVQLTNPFDLTFTPDGIPVVTDASGNGVAIENSNETIRFFHRFDSLLAELPSNETMSIDPVPTGLTRVNDEYYVTLTGGCPYPSNSGQLVAIDEQRHQRTVIEGLNMPIDVATDDNDTIWLLEFAHFTPGASCFSGEGYQANSGQLSQLQPSGQRVIMVENLNFPASVLPINNKSVYISEVFTGRVLQITFP
ncbi:MAG: ScyD/ScyE family protein [Chloroflexota bacterium]